MSEKCRYCDNIDEKLTIPTGKNKIVIKSMEKLLTVEDMGYVDITGEGGSIQMKRGSSIRANWENGEFWYTKECNLCNDPQYYCGASCKGDICDICRRDGLINTIIK